MKNRRTSSVSPQAPVQTGDEDLPLSPVTPTNRRVLYVSVSRYRRFSIGRQLRIISQLQYFLYSLKQACNGEYDFDIIVFYNDETILTELIQGRSVNDIVVDMPIQFVSFPELDERDGFTSDDMTHKWSNLRHLWNLYELVFLIDIDVVWYQNPIEVFNEFEKSQSAVGIQHGGWKIADETWEMWMYLNEVEGMSEDAIMHSVFPSVKEKGKRHFRYMANGGQFIFNTPLWSYGFDFVKEYTRIHANLVAMKQRKAEEWGEWKNTRTGGNPNEESTVNLVLALHAGVPYLIPCRLGWNMGKNGKVIMGETPGSLPIHDEDSCPEKDGKHRNSFQSGHRPLAFLHYFKQNQLIFLPKDFWPDEDLKNEHANHLKDTTCCWCGERKPHPAWNGIRGVTV